LFLEPAADFTSRDAVVANPLEDLLDDASLFGNHLVVSLAAASVFGDIAVTVWRSSQHADRTALGGVAFAAATAFHDLAAFVLRDHPLHL
jgi:hypothetical protein